MTSRIDFIAAKPELAKGLSALGQAVKAGSLDRALIDLVNIRASLMSGCAFCIDMHWRDLIKLGADARHLNTLAGWRESPFFDARERAALRWAEIVNDIPHRDPSDEEFAALKQHFSNEEIAELGFVIATINAWNLLNVSLRNPVPVAA